MKIGFTLDTLLTITGKERVVYELAKRLAKKHEVSLITFKNKTNPKIRNLFENEGIDIRLFDYKGKVNGRLYYLSKLKKYISKLDIDVINAHGLILSNAASLSSIPTVKTYHAHVTLWREFVSNPLRWIDYWLEESISIYFSKQIISISKYAMKQLKKMYLKNSLIVYNGVDLKKFRPSKRMRETFRENLNIRSDEIVVGTVGRFAPQKNHKLLLLLAKKLDFKLIIIGKGRLEPKYKLLIKKLGLQKKVRIIHYVKSLETFYNGIDVYAHPSLWESFGLPILEASASGKPTIAFNRAAMKEVILHKKSGFLANNKKEFEKYLKVLLENGEIRKKMGRFGRKHSKKFSWKNTTKKYLKIFEDVLNQ